MRGIVMRQPHYRSALATIAMVLVAGCISAMAGEPHKPDGTGATYNGPSLTIAIVKFANKTPSKILGIGEAATDILRTQLKATGLEPVDVTEDALREQDELIRLQQSGVVKTGKKNAAEGFDSVDYRIQGAVTSYSEVEEGSDMLFYQKKSQVARVGVDYALIDIATGKSLLAESGAGEWRKETGGAMGFGSRSTSDGGLRDGALRDALGKALAKMIEKLNSIPFQGSILLVENQTALIKAGEKSKLGVGTKLGVYRGGQDLIDPETGRSLGKREKMIGEVTLTSHQNDRISEARITFGNGFQAGDIVRVMK
jgi:curli biogenesis system outer membrane secretion channel CsgG